MSIFTAFGRSRVNSVVHRLESRIASLEGENAALKGENAALRKAKAALTAEADRLRQQVGQQDGRIAELEAVITALRHKVAGLETRSHGKATSKNSSRPPSQDEKPDASRPAKPRSHSHPGVNRPLAAAPDAERTVFPDGCPHCGGSALEPDGVVREYDHVEMVEKPVITTRVRLMTCTCQHCGAHVEAPPPADMPGTGLLGPRISAVLVLLRHHLDTPLDRLRCFLEEAFGLRVSEGLLVSTMTRAAAAILSDETRFRVAGTTATVWVFCAGDAVRYKVTPTRQKRVVSDFLAGAVPEAWVADRYAGQMGHARAFQACLAHLARDCVAAQEHGDQTFAPALEAILQRIMLFDRLKAGWSDSTLHDRHRTIERAIDRVLAITPTHPDGERLRSWVKGHREAVTLCLRRRDVPATNNLSERAERPVVVARKVFGCLRSWKGADAMADLRSVIATARARGMTAMQGLKCALAGAPLPRAAPT